MKNTKTWLAIAAGAMIATSGVNAQEAEATYLATPEWLGGQEVVINDWNQVEPYGWFYFFGDGWGYHDGLGYLYPLEGSTYDSTWFYSDIADFLWTGNGVFPYLYLNAPGSFFYWLGEGDAPGNWWVNLDTGTWNDVPATAEPTYEPAAE